jgi:hypothetical protein
MPTPNYENLSPATICFQETNNLAFAVEWNPVQLHS